MVSLQAISDPIKHDGVQPVALVDRMVGEVAKAPRDLIPLFRSVGQRRERIAGEHDLERRDRLCEFSDVALVVNPPSCRAAHAMPFSISPTCASAAKLLASVGLLVVSP